MRRERGASFHRRMTVFALAALLLALQRPAPASLDSGVESAPDVANLLELLREINYSSRVAVKTAAPADARRLVSELEKTLGMPPDKIALYEKTWRFLKLIPPGFDLSGTLRNVHSRQAMTLYVPSENTVYTNPRRLPPEWNAPLLRRTFEQLDIGVIEFVLARDLAYALLHQNFGTSDPPHPGLPFDRALALRASIDGGVTAMLMDYIVRESGVSVLLLPNPEAVISHYLPIVTHVERAALDALPGFVRNWFAFPFEKGVTFVFHQRKTGGNLLVNSAYKNIPLGTEQIIHPEKFYEAPDNPARIIVPDLSKEIGGGARLIYEDTCGEWLLNQLLAEWLRRKARDSVVAGWAGDTLALYESPGGALTAAWYTTWDGAGFASMFHDALVSAARHSLPPDEIRFHAERIGRDVVFALTSAPAIPPALIPRLWQSVKSPVVVPPPVPEKPAPEYLEISVSGFLSLLMEKAKHKPRQDDTWQETGDTFRNPKYRYRVKRPGPDWYFHRVQVGNMLLSEFTALNTRELGAHFTVASLAKYGGDVPNPVDEMAEILSKQLINFRKTDDRSHTVAGFPARSLTYTAFAVVPLKVTYTEVIADEFNYVLTFWAPKATYEKLLPDYKSFLESFEVIPRASK
ncbi:MAG: hypothetical protein AB1742_11025 [bacterium]